MTAPDFDWLRRPHGGRFGREVVRALCAWEVGALTFGWPTLSALTHKYRQKRFALGLVVFLLVWLVQHLLLEEVIGDVDESQIPVTDVGEKILSDLLGVPGLVPDAS